MAVMPDAVGQTVTYPALGAPGYPNVSVRTNRVLDATNTERIYFIVVVAAVLWPNGWMRAPGYAGPIEQV